MNGQNINNPGKKLNILLVPLDWGLGHATRCIPVIYTLLNAGANVLLAGEGATAAILQKEFPQLTFLPLKGYRVQYSKGRFWFMLKLLSQFVSIKKSIKEEQLWLQQITTTHKIDAVISDNRFGLYHTNIPAVYITHQLNMQTGNRLLNKFAQRIHYTYINRYSRCWVPDTTVGINLAGKLSMPNELPVVPVNYLGVLSRFKKMSVSIKTDLIVVLSGPEPQRSILEAIIIDELKHFTGSVVLVRGMPADKEILTLSQNIKVFNHLASEELSKAIQQSSILLSRAGYSTIMDLVAIQQKAILVPTPGQTEQEYIAGHLKNQKQFYSCAQQNFNLANAIKEAGAFYQSKMISAHYNEEIILDWMKDLRKSTD